MFKYTYLIYPNLCNNKYKVKQYNNVENNTTNNKSNLYFKSLSNIEYDKHKLSKYANTNINTNTNYLIASDAPSVPPPCTIL